MNSIFTLFSSIISKIPSQRRHFITNQCFNLFLIAPHLQWGNAFTHQESLCYKEYWTERGMILGVKQVFQHVWLPAPTQGSEYVLLRYLTDIETLCPSDIANFLIKSQGFWEFPRKDKSETLILPKVPTYFPWSHKLSFSHNCVFKYLVRLAPIVF